VQTESPTTPADTVFYQKNGYFRYENFYSAAAMAELRQCIDNAIETNRARILGADRDGRVSDDYEQVFNQMVNLWTDYPAARQIAFDPRVAETARRLAGCRHVRIYHDHAMVKPAGQHSRQTNWHQDAPYWGMDPVGALSAWIAIDDVTAENGCLQFVPGSHKHERLDPIHLDEDGDSIVAKMQERGFDVPEPVTMAMAAGGVTFHHGCTFHHAGPNRSDAPRRAFAIIFMPDYTTFTGNDAAGAGKEMQIGGPWDHPLHPILAGE
jgi:ectoine hydroxylase-related dioxygenase (phytanoyl-CoA dioxygenase family)